MPCLNFTCCTCLRLMYQTNLFKRASNWSMEKEKRYGTNITAIPQKIVQSALRLSLETTQNYTVAPILPQRILRANLWQPQLLKKFDSWNPVHQRMFLRLQLAKQFFERANISKTFQIQPSVMSWCGAPRDSWGVRRTSKCVFVWLNQVTDSPKCVSYFKLRKEMCCQKRAPAKQSPYGGALKKSCPFCESNKPCFFYNFWFLRANLFGILDDFSFKAL